MCVAVAQRNPSPGNPIQTSEPRFIKRKNPIPLPYFPFFLISNTTFLSHIMKPPSSSSSSSKHITSPASQPLFLKMGCCISKCRPDQHPIPLPGTNHVQDKLVIPISNKTSPSPPSPTSSASSFTCPTFSNSTVSSASSLSSASSSSALSSKDRSFSNDFLWSCYKDNPHIVRINSLKEASLSTAPSKPHIHKTNPSSATSRLTPPQKTTVGSSMPLKRVRSSSPANLTRQKSMRKEIERPNSPSPHNLPNRTLRSPSPSHRFDGGSSNPSKRMMSPKANCDAHSHSVSSLIRKESIIKPASPNRSSLGLRRRENWSFKIEETAVKEVQPKHDAESGVGMMEDIHNPLISLDCFIFL